MSKVVILQGPIKKSFTVDDATVSVGWLPGQAFKLNPTGDKAILGGKDAVIFLGADDPADIAFPPSGSMMTGLYGAGTTVIIDHSQEVSIGSSSRAYDASVESGAVNDLLYYNAIGKFTTVSSGNGGVKAIMIQKPAATNNYGLGVILRF